MSKNPNLNISVEDIEKMRDIVLSHDKQQPGNVIHDINKPPVVPYVHQQFPKMVYAPHYDQFKASHPDAIPHEVADMFLVVKSAEELEIAIAKGWLLKPPAKEVEPGSGSGSAGGRHPRAQAAQEGQERKAVARDEAVALDARAAALDARVADRPLCLPGRGGPPAARLHPHALPRV
jgi:hypothetical protein